MKYTDNHNMNLPETTDNVDIEKLNENFITIDGMLIAHPTSQNPAVTTSPTTLDWGSTFAVVTNITRDNNSHVKTFEVKILKLPASPDVKNVFTGASNGTTNGTNLPNGHVYFNLILNGAGVSSHKITGEGGTEVKTDEQGNVVISSPEANSKNVIAPAPNVPIDIVSGGDVFLNCVVDGNVVSSHKIQGNGGAKISTAEGSETDGDSVIVITSSCVKNGTFTHDTANMTIDTGFTDTPKLFKLYYYDSNENAVKLAAACRPELDAPFNFINHSALPISSIEFDGGAATINCSVATGLSFMWESYI